MMPSLTTRSGRARVAPSRGRDSGRLERGPEKSRELPGDRDGNLRGRLVFQRQLVEPPTQPLLRLIRYRKHPPRLSFAPAGERDADARPVLVVPRNFHEQAPDQRVSGAGDAAAAMLLTARVFAGHQPEIRHQGRRRGESSKVVQLGEDQHRGQRVNAAETAQPPDRRSIRLALGGKPGIQLL